MLELRDYANEGGKLSSRVATCTRLRPVHEYAASSATGPYTWTPDKLFGFYYPDNNGGDDDLPGHRVPRSRATSNDTWQNYLGVSGRHGRRR